MKKDIPFAQEGLGKILFLLSELKQKGIHWLYEQGFDKEDAVESIDGIININHDTSSYPKEGFSYLQIYQSISINFGGFESITWRILINLSVNGEQTLQARRWIESTKQLGYGEHTIKEIASLNIENGKEGVETIQEACRLVFNDMVYSLSTMAATEMYHQNIARFLKAKQEFNSKGAKS